MNNNRIKFALHSEGWNFETGSKTQLRKTGVPIPPNEYLPAMEGQVFCPECCVNVFRSPKERPHDKGGREAFYVHVRDPAPICSLRVKQSAGKKYDNEEQAAQAIENEDLLVVQEFMQARPILPGINGPVEYNGRPVEDADGIPTEVAIGRHDGESFKLPSKITTIRGLCRNFDKNYYRYLVLPGQSSALTLRDLLIDVNTITETSGVPGLYYGVIERSYSIKPARHNIRMTKIRYKQPGQADFYLKTSNELSADQGIDYDTQDRILLMYGKISNNGMGLCIERVGWGEFALLPEKYEYLFK